MAQTYEVFIEGRPLSIGAPMAPSDLPAGWRSVHVRAAEEVAPLVAHELVAGRVQGLHLHGDAARIWAWFTAGYRFVQAAGGAVTDERGRLLVIERLGRWDLPKGKVERNEAIAVAAVREVQEECGLREVRSEGPLAVTWHTYDRDGRAHLKRTDWFLMRASSAERLVAQAEEDITGVRWAEAAEVPALEEASYPSLRPVFRAWIEAASQRPA